MTSLRVIRLTAVRVDRHPFGVSSFAQSSASIEGDTLTVRCTDAVFDARFGPMQVFRPGAWISVTEVDHRGVVLSHHLSEVGKQQAAERDAALVGVRR